MSDWQNQELNLKETDAAFLLKCTILECDNRMLNASAAGVGGLAGWFALAGQYKRVKS